MEQSMSTIKTFSKYSLLLILFLSLFTTNLMAKDFTVSPITKTMNGSKEAILAIITDYEKYSAGREYALKDVGFIKILHQDGDYHFITHTFIDSTKSFYYISESNVTRSSDSKTITITTTIPSNADELARSYGVKHSPMYDSSTTTWVLTDNGDNTTTVTYSAEASAHGLIATLFGRLIQKSMESSATEQMNIIEKALGI